MDVVLIPGIGGHPCFHRSLARAIEQHAPLATSEHGDFRSAPYATVQQHSAFWRAFIDRLGPGPKLLIGVSFGSCVALDLLTAMPAGEGRAVLISHWPIGPLERRLLRCIGLLPSKIAACVLGWALFRWSETTSADPARLLSDRLALYDSRQAAWRRLLGRLLCLAATPDLATALAGRKATLVYGSSELAYRLHRRRLRRIVAAPAQLLTVPGGHAIATTDNVALEQLIATIVRDHIEEARVA